MCSRTRPKGWLQRKKPRSGTPFQPFKKLWHRVREACQRQKQSVSSSRIEASSTDVTTCVILDTSTPSGKRQTRCILSLLAPTQMKRSYMPRVQPFWMGRNVQKFSELSSGVMRWHQTRHTKSLRQCLTWWIASTGSMATTPASATALTSASYSTTWGVSRKFEEPQECQPQIWLVDFLIW